MLTPNASLIDDVNAIEDDEADALADQDEEDIEMINEDAHYRVQAEILKNDHAIQYQKQIDNIKDSYNEETNQILEEGKNLCLKMVEDQRKEVENLENEWRTARKKQIDQDLEASNSKLATARVLASFQLIDSAKTLRDTTRKQSATRSSELKILDDLFEKQYRLMIERHSKDFILLHERVKAQINNSKLDAELLKKQADYTKDNQDSQIPIVMISSVSMQAKFDTTKRSIIQTFSPRPEKRI
ncbi:hypothetical protein TVAG_099200 [Trichomonas vaginalis G3]|uniref:Uncharacterized protein n=1 Tax=Trichomonas vaginalis (strain ATCC PRA-98 / G3) TaxID=412133 RepID=A2G7H0_TRIV3|nr:hypothetical protein TVAGG3_0920320 [Trichomonas vaginalis G3]XP_051077798.1 hypothetical protein TVAGG3_0920410 [Trichomonas vaginalis G3]EAX86904.1 hypothetical protein TVAG_099200 [Trichomonas vaginalis G3]KAI5485110.1 hypothetical protein TVAGG3_0920320 [Trichomonas vaginalis G3]KAI5485115.1 hypothetical protein TVAGG3_0920410 [Trichomonas vaginalis G3]|eukprot:XP_001299834.1 hypothetical protein [Trichomonas vaginalis G3]